MYQAQFYRIDGLDEPDIGNPIGLVAENDDLAEDEALALKPPQEANFVKLLRDGVVIRRHGFAL